MKQSYLNNHLQAKKFKTNDLDIREKCLNFDMYGKPVSLTFQGREKFQTSFGATITVIVTILVVTFATSTFLNPTS